MRVVHYAIIVTSLYVYKSVVRETRVSMMAAEEVLTEICNLKELKKNTTITRSVLSTAQSLLLLKDEHKSAHLAHLITNLSSSYTAMLNRVQRYKLTATKTDKLWVLFHSFSLKEGYQLCKGCDAALGLNAHDIFWQLLLENQFLKQVINSLKLTSHPTTASGSRELTHVEENAVRYTAGYIIRKLHKKYSRQKSQEEIECSRALKEMAGKISTCPVTSEHHSREWTVLVDRGGLYHVSDMVYYLFVVLELITDRELTAIFQSRGRGMYMVKKEKLSWLCNNEEVQFIWSMISPSSIEEESVRQDLLREIAFMWVTTRGHSKAQMVKEELKKSKAKGTKGRKSLRKELAAPHAEKTD